MALEPLRADARRLATRALAAVRPTFRREDGRAFTIDPVFQGLRRNRVNAEVFKGLRRLGGAAVPEYDPELQVGILRHLLATQNPDGSWNEVHPHYDKPSALKTAFVGEALLAAESLPLPPVVESSIEKALRSARDFVLASEMRPGVFRKSETYLGDHLNVDASCASFLAAHHAATGDEGSRAGAERAARHVLSEMWEDGALPYTTNEPSPPYPHPLFVPCIHYQGVTLYYLWKTRDALGALSMDEGLLRGARWLADAQLPDGRFDWGRSGMMMAYGLSGAYAFAASTFARAARHDPVFVDCARKALRVLDANLPGIAWRWERAPMWRLPSAGGSVVRAAMRGRFPARHRLFRLGYGAYREVSRRRAAPELDDRAFRLLTRLMGIRTTIVEASRNFPDLFMTAEAIDCLADVAGAAGVTR